MEWNDGQIRSAGSRVSRRPLALVVIGTSWGAVDWILPVLHGMHERGIGIGVYFKSTQPLADAHRFSDIYQHLDGIAQFVFDPRRLVKDSGRLARLEAVAQDATQELGAGKRLKALAQAAIRLGLMPVCFYRSDRIKQRAAGSLLRRYLKEQPVDWLLHDFSQTGDEEFAETFPNAKRFLFPHGSNWWDPSSHLPSDRHRAMAAIDPRSVWLTGFQSDTEFYRSHGYRGQIRAVGQPKYDAAWISRATERGNRSHPFPVDRHNRPTVLVVTRPLRKTNEPDGVAAQTEQIMRSAAKRDMNVWIKLHPHQRPEELNPILSRVDNLQMSWCDESVLSAAAQADLVIAQPSSAVLDTVAAGTPTIEYFDYAGQSYITFVKQDGKSTSPYRQAGIVEAANDPAELDRLLDEMVRCAGFREQVSRRQRRCLDMLLPNRGNSTQHALEIILNNVADGTARSSEAA